VLDLLHEIGSGGGKALLDVGNARFNDRKVSLHVRNIFLNIFDIQFRERDIDVGILYLFFALFNIGPE